MATAREEGEEASLSAGEDERAKEQEDDRHDQVVGDLRQETELTTSLYEEKDNDEDDDDTFEDALEEINKSESATKATEEYPDEEKSSEEEQGEEPAEDNLTDEQKEDNKSEAQENKMKGNEYFKNSEYPEAKEYYTRAIRVCPRQFSKERAVFYANRAACLMKMDLYKEATKDCTKGVELNPEYVKARLRRAQCYEHEDRLEEALEDYQKVFDVDRSSHVAREALMRLPEQIKIKHEKMKEEMLGKLKDLGNVFLKPFGLSTNNFQMQQDPKSGGYNINFQK